MTNRDFSALLDIPAFPADGYAKIADRLGAILNTKNDILLMQGEAILALEAVATSIARQGLRALNIVTSPYGAWFGNWLKRGGAEVIDLHADAGQAITVEAVDIAINGAAVPFDILCVVHAESASGILNPLEEIAALAKTRDILTIVDAVASVGGQPLNVDESALDIVVIGPQKALGGPAGVSAISISEKAWPAFDHAAAPKLSILSILDQKEQWLDAGRGALPGTPAPLEFFALEAALDRIEHEGLERLISRHSEIARQTKRALRAGGLSLWASDNEASPLVTTFIVPVGVSRADILAVAKDVSGSTLSDAVGPGTDHLIRINHTGPNAGQQILQRNLEAIANAASKLGFAFNLDASLSTLKQ